jgi:hypothetical protein
MIVRIFCVLYFRGKYYNALLYFKIKQMKF